MLLKNPEYKQTFIGFKPEDLTIVCDAEAEINADNMCPVVKPDEIADKYVHKIIILLRFLSRGIVDLSEKDSSEFADDLCMHLAKHTDEYKNIFSKIAEKHGKMDTKAEVDSIDNIQSK